VVKERKVRGASRYARRYVRYPACAVLVLALVLGAGGHAPPEEQTYPEPVPLRVSGLIGSHPSPGSTLVISPDGALGAAYLPSSNVLRLPGGELRYVPPGSSEAVTAPPGDPGALAAAAATRRWLEEGTVPGENEVERRISERALLNLALLTRPNGAALAGPHSRWSYVWPRDASFMAVTFAATGHHEESYRILEFLAGAQDPDGAWEARYNADGTPVLDGRSRQLDAVGWFPWAVWYWYVTGGRPAAERVERLWPATRAAADAAATSLGADGLPPGGADYWEAETWRPNLGTAAPLRAGLRAAADLARRLGHEPDARRYAQAAARLDGAIDRKFAPLGYPRTTRARSGADAAVNFLAPPFAPPDPQVEAAVADAAQRLRAPNGGLVPGESWPHDPTVAWTPETALFALSASASGDERGSARWLGWLAAHRTTLGAFPEKVDGEGEPKSAAPLGWTEAIVLLALASEDDPLPTPPVPKPSPETGGTLPIFAGLCAALLGFAVVRRSPYIRR
jgi:glucoamylase